MSTAKELVKLLRLEKNILMAKAYIAMGTKNKIDLQNIISETDPLKLKTNFVLEEIAAITAEMGFPDLAIRCVNKMTTKYDNQSKVIGLAHAAVGAKKVSFLNQAENSLYNIPREAVLAKADALIEIAWAYGQLGYKEKAWNITAELYPLEERIDALAKLAGISSKRYYRSRR